ncbi:MAG: prepilin peptidase [Solirubrobacterales bacterium]|nr:prepilin peptidase [Solirubrobacterales bacterium]
MTGSSSIPVSTPAATDDPWLRTPSVVAPFVVGVVVLALATLPLDRGVVAAFAAAVLVVLSAIDLERGIIPNRIVLPAAALALTMQVALFPDRAAEWALAGVLGAAVFAVPHLFRRDWIGMGDVKLVLLIGVVLGWSVANAAFIAFLCVFPVALLMLVRNGLGARKSTIPLGPFLSLGALIVLLPPV